MIARARGRDPLLPRTVLEEWAHLEESIRRGRPAVPGYEAWLGQDRRRWAVFQAGILAVARMSGDDVVAKVKLPPGARRLLDVDGGHGLYSIRFCRRHPGLMATVFDLPQALDAARQTIVAERMTDRVSVQRGNFAHDDLGSGYDVGQLPGKAMGPVAEAVARLQALNMLNAAASQAYAFEDIPGWLAAAGFAGARGKP